MNLQLDEEALRQAVERDALDATITDADVENASAFFAEIDRRQRECLLLREHLKDRRQRRRLRTVLAGVFAGPLSMTMILVLVAAARTLQNPGSAAASLTILVMAMVALLRLAKSTLGDFCT